MENKRTRRTPHAQPGSRIIRLTIPWPQLNSWSLPILVEDKRTHPSFFARVSDLTVVHCTGTAVVIVKAGGGGGGALPIFL